MHNGVDRMLSCQWVVELDPRTKRLNRFVARVDKRCRGLKADPCSTIGEGKVGCMGEL
jgi:hypothetical protein